MDNLILIHGFGMPMAIFDDLILSLKNKFNCINIELPGDKAASELFSLNEYIDFIVSQIKKPAIILGWSLGGMLALVISKRYPSLVKKLILISSTVKFTNVDNWEYGIDNKDLLLFFNQMKHNYQKTIGQFLSLQTMGAPDQKILIRQLKKTINTNPDMASLTFQLNLLKKFDFRNMIHTINIPTLWITGDMDKLTPAKAAINSAKMMPNASCLILEKCGHLPFYTHFDIFYQEFLRWTKSN